MRKFEILLFNVAETALIFMTGAAVYRLAFVDMLIMTFIFASPRMIFKGASHYKSPIKCMIVSWLLTVAMFGMFFIDNRLGYTAALFSGSLLTEKGNILNIYQCAFKNNGEPSRYQVLFDYLPFNRLSDEYIEAEKELRSRVSGRDYVIYKRIFIDRQTWDEVQSDLDISKGTIKTALDVCYYYLIGKLGI